MDVKTTFLEQDRLIGYEVEITSNLLVDINNEMILSDDDNRTNEYRINVVEEDLLDKTLDHLTCCVGGKYLVYFDRITIIGELQKTITNELILKNVQKLIIHYDDEDSLVSLVG
ncbi:hypothetical protein OLMES_3310 [Oleiphilus messinensis]|uniref:Uncharacterized protein n=1 Tax=Oleiphilus messinensis TaxID=141451 RepID=A0A1Y0IAS2_9GAMM|nr:hypothetical protein [Oleiphilus messinensis]ARU57350.1 hypothetical protein OLMES_3310 [Oleiphilus messinensis]